MSKGSKRRVEDSKKIQDNWDEINWGNIYCYRCDVLLDEKNLEDNPDDYIFYPDGMVEHKNCKF